LSNKGIRYDGLVNQSILHELAQNLSHVLWIGGGADAGKTTVTQILALRHDWNVYHYDRTDGIHHALLALTNPEYAAFDAASVRERWVQPSVATMVQRSLDSFKARFPFVLSDIHMFNQDRPLLIEGFGLTPDLIAPLLTSPHQAVWLMPSQPFKLESMKRRDKPAFRHQTLNPELVWQKFFERDNELARRSKLEAQALGLTVVEVNGTLNPEQFADKLEDFFLQDELAQYNDVLEERAKRLARETFLPAL
jgi:hypothetical protein